MNIAIDVSPLSSGHSGRGVGVYTRLLLEALQTHERDHAYTLITAGQQIPSDTDVVHYPYFDPFFLTLPIIRAKATVVTVHDLIPLLFPGHFPRGLKGELKWRIQKNSLRSVKRIITDSDTSKRDIARLIAFPSDCIDRVYLGPSMTRKEKSGSPLPAEIKKMLPKSRRYILYVGDVNWNKNIPGILQAFGQIAKKNTDISLMLVGSAFTNLSLKEAINIRELIHRLDLERRVITPGFVDEHLLSAVYRNAFCLLSPSFYEGFGIPLMDALVQGCPAVVSNRASLAEIAGPSVLVNPDNPDDIAGGIRSVLHWSPSERETRIRNGKEWSQKFTWKKTAHETVAAYAKAII